MSSLSVVPHAATAVLAAAMGILAACGGRDDAASAEASPLAESQSAMEGAHVSGRDEALLLMARGAVAPIHTSELAHAALVRLFESRSDGAIDVEIEAADNAESLLLRGEAGFVRAVLRFNGAVIGGATLDGIVTLEASRALAGAGLARRCQADALSITDRLGTRRWSYLDVAVDAEQRVQRLSLVSDVTVDAASPVWMDVTSSTPGQLDTTRSGTTLISGRYVATGVIGFLKARLTLQVGADQGWTIEVDNDKDDQVDFVVRASADEVLALAAGP